jgi:predicted ATPase
MCASAHATFSRALDRFRDHVLGILGRARDEAAVIVRDIDTIRELLAELATATATAGESQVRLTLQVQDELVRLHTHYVDLYDAILRG